MRKRVFAVLALWIVPASGEELPALHATGSIDLGWTSNATDSAIGKSDVFVTHTESLSLEGEGDGFALRGALTFSEQRFRLQDFEDDRSGALELALGKQVTDALLLRGSLSVSVASIGDDLNLSGLYLATITPKVAIEAAGEIVHAADGHEARLALTYGARRAGDTVFPGLALTPVRLTADVDSLALAASWRQAIGDDVAIKAGALARMTGVSETDRTLYARSAVHGFRLSAGADAVLAERIIVAAEGGGEVLWSERWSDQHFAPYLSLSAEAALTDALTFSVALGTSTELAQPLDSVASAIDQATAALILVPLADLTVSASASLQRERSLLAASLETSQIVLAAGFDHRPTPHLSYGARIAQTRYLAAVDSYDKTEIVVSVSGSL